MNDMPQPELPQDVAAKAAAIYDLGPTAMFASKADPRFHYALYVPPAVGDGEAVELLVAVHGMGDVKPGRRHASP